MAEKINNKTKQVFSKLKKKEVLFAVAVIVVMLIIYFSSTGNKDDTTTKKERVDFDYCTTIQAETQNFVKKMSGDENAKVVIGWESSVEEVIAYTISTNGNSSTTTPVIIHSSGESAPIVLKTIYPKVVGVVVVFKGANDTRKKIEVMEMVSTLLGISPEKVAVYASK